MVIGNYKFPSYILTFLQLIAKVTFLTSHVYMTTHARCYVSEQYLELKISYYIS